MSPILEVKGLKTQFVTEGKVIPAVDGVDFCLESGKTLGIVGESGCGKSVTSLSIMRLIPNPPGKIVGGSILVEGKDILKISEKEMQKIRGNEISMIFQEPMTSLNPCYTIGNQMMEALRVHEKVSKGEAIDRVVELLKKVSISRPGEIFKSYSYELSGGMRQRIMIAMALLCKPKILIADEPTTALDVTIQIQILELMKQLQRENNTAVMIITHDLGVIAEMADEVAVMYAGKVVEQASCLEIFDNPMHPYTIGLHHSTPKITGDQERLETITGMVPNLANPIKGCAFKTRCREAMPICGEKCPDLIEVGAGHKVRCWKYCQQCQDEGGNENETVQ